MFKILRPPAGIVIGFHVTVPPVFPTAGVVTVSPETVETAETKVSGGKVSLIVKVLVASTVIAEEVEGFAITKVY